MNITFVVKHNLLFFLLRIPNNQLYHKYFIDLMLKIYNRYF